MNLDSKVELAFQRLLNGVNARIVTSIEEEERIPPFVLISSEGGPEDPPKCGNQRLIVNISIHTEIDPEIEHEPETPKADHLALVEEVENIILIDDLAEQLTGTIVDELTVMDAWRESTIDGQDNEDRHYITVQAFNVYAGQF